MSLFITEYDLTTLKDSLLFCNMQELREISTSLGLNAKLTKLKLITTIVHFAATGEKLTEPKIPAISRAQRGKTYILAPESLMLKGAYKNDLATRLFFKKLIGEYFHFTAFGIDWLNERWLVGKPPSYQEFADFWAAEYQARKSFGSTPKEEWAHINFVQAFIQANPSAEKNEILSAWIHERLRNVKIARDILSKSTKQCFLEHF